LCLGLSRGTTEGRRERQLRFRAKCFARMAMVDEPLRVHGMQGLRIADASIVPTLTSGNTNAQSIMIGEEASRVMLAAV
jgi:hypothetical protein